MKGLHISLMMAALLMAQPALAVTQKSNQDDAAPAAAAKPAGAGAQLGEKYDTKLPIEISSDNLEVLQHENKAIFKGNVISVQGKIRLAADTMIVHYKQQSQPGAAGTPATPAPAPAPVQPAPAGGKPDTATSSSAQGTMGAITLIEVEGNVFMATPEESAKGDKGDYKVTEKLLHLTGDNVILTRDKNILRGTEMVYNLETGRSVLTNKGAKVGGSNAGRVRGVFVPQDNNPKGAAKGKGKTAPGNMVKNDATIAAPATNMPVATPPATPETPAPDATAPSDPDVPMPVSSGDAAVK